MKRNLFVLMMLVSIIPFSSCMVTTATIKNVTKVVNLRPADVKCSINHPFEVENSNSMYYSIGGRDSQKSKENIIEREIVKQDPQDKFWLQLDEFEFGSYGSNALLLGIFKSWANMKFSQCGKVHKGSK